MNYYELRIKSGNTVHASGYSAQDAAENAGVDWDSVESYEDSSKISHEHYNQQDA